MASLLAKLGLRKRTGTQDKHEVLRETSPLFTADENEQMRKMTFEEQVIFKTQKLYRDPEQGLCTAFRELGAPEPDVPERKINILIIGNHSSGKSTFINWYVGDDIQKTGVAMETSKFTLVCHGKRRETLSAGAITKLFPNLNAFEKIPGAMEHLSGEVSTSNAHRFALVNFIDSPGIVDGERYNFDFDRALETCAQMADLIFVFFDPQGQALCQRTLAHLERLCVSQANKLSLWMTKCDMVKGEADLMKVTQQISRELARRPTIAKHELWLTPIYVPGHSDNQPAGLNQLSVARSQIDKCIAVNLQNKVLRNMLQQCDYLENLAIEKRAAEQYGRLKTFSGFSWKRVTLVALIVLISALVGLFLVDEDYLAEISQNVVDPNVAYELKSQYHEFLAEKIKPEWELATLAGAFMLIAVLAWQASKEPRAAGAVTTKDDELKRPWFAKTVKKIKKIREEADQLFKDFLNLTLDV